MRMTPSLLARKPNPLHTAVPPTLAVAAHECHCRGLIGASVCLRSGVRYASGWVSDKASNGTVILEEVE